MWAHEHEARTALAPEAIWAVLRDIDHWAEWDTSMESVELVGPFAVGSEVVMVPVDQGPITSTITDVVEPTLYADETAIGEVTLRFSHTLTALDDGGTHVVHRLEITGPGADRAGPDLGPMITQDFPDAMAALLARAAG